MPASLLGTDRQTTGPLQVGILLTNTSGFAAAGINVGQSVTDRQIYQALINALNASGGIGGRHLEPIWSTVGGDNWSTDFQAACANFTQDHHVEAVLGYAFIFMDSFESCLLKAGIPHLFGGYAPGDLTSQRQYPNVFSTTHPTVNIHLLTALEGAVSTGLLSKASKLGIAFDSCNNNVRAFNTTVVPYLRAQGIQYHLFVADCMGGNGDAGRSVQQVQSAELQFRSSGIDTIFVEGPGALLFMENAESQAWHPTYLMTYGGAGLEGNVPADQLANVHGFGWTPSVDVDPQHQPGPWRPAQRRCLAMLKAGGVVPTGYNDFGEAFTMCDALFMYGDSLHATRGRTDASDVISALQSRAPTFAGTSTYGGLTRATTTQRGGAAEWRAWGWTAACSCFTYTGPTHPMPD